MKLIYTALQKAISKSELLPNFGKLLSCKWWILNLTYVFFFAGRWPPYGLSPELHHSRFSSGDIPTPAHAPRKLIAFFRGPIEHWAFKPKTSGFIPNALARPEHAEGFRLWWYGEDEKAYWYVIFTWLPPFKICFFPPDSISGCVKSLGNIGLVKSVKTGIYLSWFTKYRFGKVGCNNVNNLSLSLRLYLKNIFSSQL